MKGKWGVEEHDTRGSRFQERRQSTVKNHWKIKRQVSIKAEEYLQNSDNQDPLMASNVSKLNCNFWKEKQMYF